MLELGSFSEQYHQELGQWLVEQAGLSALITVGDEATLIDKAFKQSTVPHTHVGSSDDIGAGIEKLKLDLSNSLILLKGSRGYHLEAWLTTCKTTV